MSVLKTVTTLFILTVGESEKRLLPVSMRQWSRKLFVTFLNNYRCNYYLLKVTPVF